MAAIKSKNTAPEVFIRKLMFHQGFRYRICDKNLPGTPDIVLKKYKAVVFVHGCFWHAHKGCSKAKLPQTHLEFWTNKIRSNKERDENVVRELNTMGYRVLIVWGCACKKRNISTLSAKIKSFILNKEGPLCFEIGDSDISI